MSRSDDHALARSEAALRADEWRLLVSARPNTLLEGTNEETGAILGEALNYLPKPHGDWADGIPPRRPATLIVRAVSALDRDQQRQLLEWLNQPGERVQVIATTSEPLHRLVASGAFLVDLYYRLNVLLLHGSGVRPA
jgi:hypothetical protein